MIGGDERVQVLWVLPAQIGCAQHGRLGSLFPRNQCTLKMRRTTRIAPLLEVVASQDFCAVLALYEY